MKQRLITSTLVLALLSQSGCGTLIYPERRGQSSGRIDPAVAILDGVGVLLFIVPGLIAFAVDFATGAIYYPGGRTAQVDPAKLQPNCVPPAGNNRPADKLENSLLLALLVGFAGVAYLVQYFAKGGTLNLNIVNFLFLFLAIVLHGTPRRLLHSLQQAIAGGAGIVIQFPFYAGIMAIMVQSGLAQSMSQWFVSFASAETLAFWSFISAGIVNIFVPSGGGQWAVQAPVMLPAALELGADVSRIAMAVAWGDAWTNLIQPFWALPVLAIAGLKAKDIMGYCLLQLIVTGVIISLVLSFV